MLQLIPNPASPSKPPQLVFALDPTLDFTYCRICGAYFCHPAKLSRQVWSHKHSQTHSERQHHFLSISNLWLLPDAAHKLASAGIISLTDLVMDDEIEAALYESSPILRNAP